MKKVKELLKSLTIFERCLWAVSTLGVIIAFLISPDKDYLTLISSIIGLAALIFTAKGYVIGQVLIVVFSVFYGIISYHFRYYREMITYLCMSSPIAIAAVISWARNPYGKTREVKVSKITKKQVTVMIILAIFVTVGFYFILKALGNANLLVSTFSVTTSFVAAYMTYLRSPYYALGYVANDMVLISLWISATVKDISSLPMVICFSMFFINDTYAFINWQRMKKRQAMFFDEDL